MIGARERYTTHWNKLRRLNAVSWPSITLLNWKWKNLIKPVYNTGFFVILFR